MEKKNKILSIKPRTNKTNGQINLALPKKEISSEDLDKILKGKKMEILKWRFK